MTQCRFFVCLFAYCNDRTQINKQLTGKKGRGKGSRSQAYAHTVKYLSSYVMNNSLGQMDAEWFEELWEWKEEYVSDKVWLRFEERWQNIAPTELAQGKEWAKANKAKRREEEDEVDEVVEDEQDVLSQPGMDLDQEDEKAEMKEQTSSEERGDAQVDGQQRWPARGQPSSSSSSSSLISSPSGSIDGWCHDPQHLTRLLLNSIQRRQDAAVQAMERTRRERQLLEVERQESDGQRQRRLLEHQQRQAEQTEREKKWESQRQEQVNELQRERKEHDVNMEREKEELELQRRQWEEKASEESESSSERRRQLDDEAKELKHKAEQLNKEHAEVEEIREEAKRREESAERKEAEARRATDELQRVMEESRRAAEEEERRQERRIAAFRLAREVLPGEGTPMKAALATPVQPSPPSSSTSPALLR